MALPTERVPGEQRGYHGIAWAMGEELLYYGSFGSYEGEWVLFSAKGDTYYIRRGSYGSCSGCDSWQARAPGTREDMEKFSADYVPFMEIPGSTMANVAVAGPERLREIMPGNLRERSEVNWGEALPQMCMAAKLREGASVTADDIYGCDNQELKRRALEVYGFERFFGELGAREIDSSGDDRLLRIKDHVYVYVKDSSTPRRYLLRVPPDATRLRAAVAWTFGLREDEYAPLVET